MRYASAADTLAWLAAGSDGQYLRLVSGAPAWATLPTYDNYGSWTFAVDGASKDPITSGDTLDFVGGTGISISRSGDDQITITNTETDTWRGIDDSPVNGQTSESITSNWAYDHAVGQTVNLHTKLGTISSGTWQGSAIDSDYLDSTPLFSTMRLDGSASASGTDGEVTLGHHNDGMVIYEPTAGPQSGSYYRMYTLASPAGWIVETSTSSIYYGNNVHPKAGSTYALGNATYDWNTAYISTIFSENSLQTYDHVDDLAIIDTLVPTEDGTVNTKNLPEGIQKDGFINMNNFNGFLIGSIKQLHAKVKEQSKVIEYLLEQIEKTGK